MKEMNFSANPTLSKELIEFFNLNIHARDEDVFGINQGLEALTSLEKGYLAAEHRQKLDLWEVRRRGQAIGERLNWDRGNTESWIFEQQEIYKKGFDYYFARLDKKSPREFGLVEYVKLL